jgi:hypothetical protein
MKLKILERSMERKMKMVDFSTSEGKALFEREVCKRMEPPFLMERGQAEMLVAALLWQPAAEDETPEPNENRT